MGAVSYGPFCYRLRRKRKKQMNRQTGWVKIRDRQKACPSRPLAPLTAFNKRLNGKLINS